jgi:hypothetical protein
MKRAWGFIFMTVVVWLMALQAAPPNAVANRDKLIQFKSIEIWIDSKQQPLAAYQLEFKPSKGDVKIVGIEGGEHAQFAQPPYYDPAAMRQERVIIAAFSTASPQALPNQKTRIATIHVQVTGETNPEFIAKPMAIATVDGAPIEATIELK